jgi:hypothetical protein
LLERIISPAILLPKTSLRLGDTDIDRYSWLYCSLQNSTIKTIAFKTATMMEKLKRPWFSLPLNKGVLFGAFMV